ncbi:hypothetical protein VNO77_43734 [Canavalia gladiata]|uniref:Uncharacterized protein n=1 Tax=Canavalia gladiata TaxID=3824 RepID=A0AAN9PQ54_CANGL
MTHLWSLLPVFGARNPLLTHSQLVWLYTTQIVSYVRPNFSFLNTYKSFRSHDSTLRIVDSCTALLTCNYVHVLNWQDILELQNRAALRLLRTVVRQTLHQVCCGTMIPNSTLLFKSVTEDSNSEIEVEGDSK